MSQGASIMTEPLTRETGIGTHQNPWDVMKDARTGLDATEFSDSFRDADIDAAQPVPENNAPDYSEPEHERHPGDDRAVTDTRNYYSGHDDRLELIQKVGNRQGVHHKDSDPYM